MKKQVKLYYGNTIVIKVFLYSSVSILRHNIAQNDGGGRAQS